MAFGLGLGCCCNRCASLKNCETEGVITSTSDLSAYEVGDVLLRDASEGGGCWEILSLTAACISPETFTVAGGPFTGETACQDCLSPQADGCQECGSDPAVEGEPGVTVDWSFQNFAFGTAFNENGAETTYLGSGKWEAHKTITCGGNQVELKVVWECNGERWQATLFIDGSNSFPSLIVSGGGGIYDTAFGPGGLGLPGCSDGSNESITVTWHHTDCFPM